MRSAAMPLPAGRKERTLVDDKAQLPLVRVEYPIPGVGKPGNLEMSVIASVLGDGNSARLVRTLQRERRVAVQVQTGVVAYHEAAIFMVRVVPAPGVTTRQVADAVEQELAQVAREGLRPAELRRVKAGLRTARLNAMQELESVAGELAENEVAFGDPAATDAEMRALSKLKPAQAREAARKFLTPDNATVLIATPKNGGRP